MKLRLDEIELDPTLYPRLVPGMGEGHQWQALIALKHAYQVNKTIEPVVVGKRNRRYVLIDGWRRYKVLQSLKEERIPVVVSSVKPAGFFLEAVRRNARHGEKLGFTALLTAALRLQLDGYDKGTISDAVQMPEEYWTKMVSERFERQPVGDDVAKVPVGDMTKEPLKLLGEGELWFMRKPSVPQGRGVSAETQRLLADSNQAHLLAEVITLLEHDLLDVNDEEVVQLTSKLQSLLLTWRPSRGLDSATL